MSDDASTPGVLPLNKYAPNVQGDEVNVYGTPRVFAQMAVLGSVGFGCAHTDRIDRDATLRRIQQHEQRIAVERARMAEADCPGRMMAALTICAESSMVCQLAKAADGREAQQRCLVTADACRAANEQAGPGCAKSGPEATLAVPNGTGFATRIPGSHERT